MVGVLIKASKVNNFFTQICTTSTTINDEHHKKLKINDKSLNDIIENCSMDGL